MISCIAGSALTLLDDAACRAWWLRRLHPAGGRCPQCGISVTGVRVESWNSDRLLHCRGCGKWFDNRTDTFLSGLRVDWRQLTLLVTLLSAGLKPVQIAPLCQISEDTVRRFAQRLKEAAGV